MSDEGTKSSVGEEEAGNDEAPDIHQEPRGPPEQVPPEQGPPADMFYSYEGLHSRATITPDSEIPENLLHLFHSFGYDSGRRSNLKLLNETTLLFIAGNLLVLLDVSTRQQRYMRSCSGGGIGAVAVHPAREFFSVAEKGNNPGVIIYAYPLLRPYRILRGGTEREYSFVDFNPDGRLVASVGAAPDYMLTLWNWRCEEVMLSCKAVSQEVYRVSFSPYNPGALTSSGSGHIKFWKMATTFTGLKLQGVMGHFGKTAATDIEGYVELPDGKVVSGTEWGNLLLWEGNTIQVEISRKEGRSCHTGTVQPFSLEDGQLMTFGADGAVRAWDLEKINSASLNSSSSFQMEPVNELLVGHNVRLSSVVRSPVPDSFVWFAQDSNGAIWKLDLSFTNTAADPECLFSFHSGEIQGLDVSKKSHLMATTTLDRSVRVFDFVAKRELVTTRFNQGGTALCWAPPMVNQSGGLLVTGFEDGVVRLLELYDPQRLLGPTQRGPGAELRLRQAFKPHSAAVTAVAFDRNGEILAVASLDCTVFFFTVGENYHPIGFIQVPGPVKALEFSPPSHSENRLLILCGSGQAVEVHAQDLCAQDSSKTFELQNLPRSSFVFKSIKSRIKRQEEIARRKAVKEKKRKEQEELLKKLLEDGMVFPDKEEEEEDEALPPIVIPNPPSPLCCGFYSQPGQFWLSMGGFDAGFLYHCKLVEDRDEDPLQQRQDEPFAFRHIGNADDDPICSVTFSSDRRLLLCGMQSGSIRVYPLQPGDLSLSSMQAYWALSVHDNQYGHVRHVRCSLDDLFVLTAGGDGNIFSFCLLPPEKLQENLERKARIPSPRVGVENEALALDIEDPAAYSIETAKQKTEKDNLRREAELMEAEMQRQLLELQRRFKQVVSDNQSLPEHIRLKPQELLLDRRFYERAEKLKARKVMEIRDQMSWEQERCCIALRKLQEWSDTSLQNDVVTVAAIRSNHRVSMYRLPPLPQPLTPEKPRSVTKSNGEAAHERRKPRAEPAKDSRQSEEEAILQPSVVPKARIKLGARQEEKLRKAAEKAEKARAKIERRKEEWAQIYAEKPEENYVDPQDVRDIQEAKESIRDFIRGKQLRVNAEQKKKELVDLEKKIHDKQADINRQIVALRDFKVGLVSWLEAQARLLLEVQQRLPGRLRKPPPTPTAMLPEETPERKLQVSRATLERYRSLRQQRIKCLDPVEKEEAVSLLELVEKETELEEENNKEDQDAPGVTGDDQEVHMELSELEAELQKEEEIRLTHQQDCLIQQMERSVVQFDQELRELHRHKLHLDSRLKLADLQLLTLLQEMLLLKQFEKREGALQEKLSGCVLEERNITLKLEEYKELLELRRSDIAKLQDREKALASAFKASLGENNLFQEFLTKVFRKKIKQVKAKEAAGNEDEEKDSEEDSDSDSDDDYDSDMEEEGAAFDDSVCPKGCEPELYENTLQLRERRLDLEELLTEEKRTAEALKKESDLLVKKEKLVKGNRQAVEDDLELINKEKQLKMNKLDRVVPLRLHQIAFLEDGSMPSDLSEALVLERTELRRLHQLIRQLEAEKVEQKDLQRQARQQRNRLIHEGKDKAARIQELQMQCDELLMTKFGRLVDLEALQMLSGSRRLEELKQERLLIEAAQAKEIEHWDAKIEETLEELTETMKTNNNDLFNMATLHEQMKELELKLNSRQKRMGKQQFQDLRRRMDRDAIQQLQTLVEQQSEQAAALVQDIDMLSSKGGHVSPHQLAQRAPVPPLTPTSDASDRKQGDVQQ